MKKKLRQKAANAHKLFFLFFLLLFSVVAYSQTVTGTVTDADNKPISKATINVKGTTRRSLTDDAGKFSIRASGNDVLVISNVGFTSQEVGLNGQQSVNITLEIAAQNMENVVVTALGIRRETRKLGYSAETVKVNELQQSRTNNVAAALEGKVAGLDVTPPSSGAGSSTKIRLRGQSFFAGSNNSPLIVI